MAKFYNIRVIEADTRDEAVRQINDGEANFLDNVFLADCILSFDDLAERIQNSYN